MPLLLPPYIESLMPLSIIAMPCHIYADAAIDTRPFTIITGYKVELRLLLILILHYDALMLIRRHAFTPLRCHMTLRCHYLFIIFFFFTLPLFRFDAAFSFPPAITPPLLATLSVCH